MTAVTSLAWPDRYFLQGAYTASDKRPVKNSGLATRDYAVTTCVPVCVLYDSVKVKVVYTMKSVYPPEGGEYCLEELSTQLHSRLNNGNH